MNCIAVTITLFLLAASIECICETSNRQFKFTPRIVDGSPAKEGQFRGIVSIPQFFNVFLFSRSN